MADKLFDVDIMCPDRSFYHGKATMVEFNTTEGYIGVYPEHIPLAVILAPGILRIYEENGEEKEAALHEGIAEISQTKIRILAEVAEWPDEIDATRAEEARIRAERRLNGSESGIDIQRAEVALKKSLTRISLKK